MGTRGSYNQLRDGMDERALGKMEERVNITYDALNEHLKDCAESRKEIVDLLYKMDNRIDANNNKMERKVLIGVIVILAAIGIPGAAEVLLGLL